MHIHSGFRLDFIGIGTIRGASSWLYTCLQDHHEICMSTPKETHFFSDENLFSLGIQGYANSYFRSAASSCIHGEFDPSYLHQPKALQRIKKLYPDIKLIVCLRNPVERAHSHFLKHLVKGKNVPNNFSEVISKRTPIYLEPGFYNKHLNFVYERYPEEKVCVILYEDLKKSPKTVIRELYKFIGADHNLVPHHLKDGINVYGTRIPSSVILNRKIYTLERLVGTSKPLVVLGKTFGLHHAKNYLKKKNMTSSSRVKEVKPTIHRNDYNELLSVYEHDIFLLQKLLKRNLSSWLEER